MIETIARRKTTIGGNYERKKPRGDETVKGEGEGEGTMKGE